jgi:hypothetical protein
MATARRASSQPVAIVELDGAEVREERHVRGQLAHAEGRGDGVGLQRRALRADAHGHAARLGRLRQPAVDRLQARRATGHRGDEERDAEGPAEEGARGRHGLQVQLGQRAVAEAVALQPGRELRADRLLEVDADVVELALGRAGARALALAAVVGLGHGRVGRNFRRGSVFRKVGLQASARVWRTHPPPSSGAEDC